MHSSPLGSEFRDGVIRVVPETDEIIAVCLEGEFDLANAPALGDRIDCALASGTGLIVDLSEATFIDSTVVHVLVRASEAAAARDQTVVLQFGAGTVAERILEIVGIERVMRRAHDRQEAVRIIQQHATLPRPYSSRFREWELLRREAHRARVEAEEIREAAREACARAEVQVDRARRLASTITVHLPSSIMASDLAWRLSEQVYLIERPQGMDVKITECNGDTVGRICDWARRNRLQAVNVTVDGEAHTLAT